MKIGLYWYQKPNLGDVLNQRLVTQIFPKLKPKGDENVDAVLLAIGSVLGMKDQHDYLPNKVRIVWGTGYQYETPRKLPIGSDFMCVRGMFTCDRYALDFNKAVADPAILMPLYYPRTVQPSKDMATVFKWNFKIINPTYIYGPDEFDANIPDGSEANLDAFLTRLWSYRLVQTDSLHVAIMCDVYSIPWRPMRWEPKWMDHFQQVGLPRRPDGFALSDRSLLSARAVALLIMADKIKEIME